MINFLIGRSSKAASERDDDLIYVTAEEYLIVEQMIASDPDWHRSLLETVRARLATSDDDLREHHIPSSVSRIGDALLAATGRRSSVYLEGDFSLEYFRRHSGDT